MSEISILHNPRCSKSRQTLQLLQDRGITPDVIEYLKTPLDKQSLSDLFDKLPVDDIEQMMRVKEPEFKEAGLIKGEVSKEQGLAAMVQYPKLIERPVVFTASQARIGRPPESVLDIV
ncbi:arsenate reductase (glutaredoxin) [Salinimonas sp. HHU 13199]|uniref:Arsenate reductase n=1 Tax=Salinimonas profundi TaxID=2729140 RepID=A0ABR8LDJ9_9ALTE|nr:arsenate reductase (glutaredoxin) [Salinimonas profundi]MBD3584386.1 arsenate reductase (glutaredoxin) [Salinimonas profundi]